MLYKFEFHKFHYEENYNKDHVLYQKMNKTLLLVNLKFQLYQQEVCLKRSLITKMSPLIKSKISILIEKPLDLIRKRKSCSHQKQNNELKVIILNIEILMILFLFLLL
jgi:hypothetical protein